MTHQPPGEHPPGSIALVYFAGCPHVQAARQRLAEALRRAGLPPRWEEWDVLDPFTPAPLRGWPSPTILVEGRSVTGEASQEGAATCRADGAPSVLLLLAALGIGRARAETGHEPHPQY